MVIGSSSSPSGAVLLRDVEHRDLPTLFEYRSEQVASEMAAVPRMERDAFMDQWAKILRDDSVIKKAIVFKGRVVGHIVCFEKSGRRLLGYWIGQKMWGKGIATRALFQFVSEIRARPLYAHVAKHNVASIRVLEKCGFILSGEDKAPARDGGTIIDEFVYMLLTGPVPTGLLRLNPTTSC
jgi:RimJ/RimL family protein N-acetyltransferase